MGTNYYTKIKECKCCGRFEEIHLGKSSYGWKFCFNLNGEKYYKNYEELKDFLKDKIIKNEYGEEVSFKEFINLIENKQSEKNSQTDYGATSINGYVFYDCEFS
jgi:hypothetical protein